MSTFRSLRMIPLFHQGYIKDTSGSQTLRLAHLLPHFTKSSLNYPTSHVPKLIFSKKKANNLTSKVYPLSLRSSSSSLKKPRFLWEFLQLPQVPHLPSGRSRGIGCRLVPKMAWCGEQSDGCIVRQDMQKCNDGTHIF